MKLKTLVMAIAIPFTATLLMAGSCDNAEDASNDDAARRQCQAAGGVISDDGSCVQPPAE